MSKIKLIESVIISKNEIKKIPLKESNSKIIAEGKEYNSTNAYEMPIWRLDQKNLNERVYTSKLAEKVCKENKVTLSLADHPQDDGSVKDIVAVSKNPHVKEGILWADCYFVDENFGKKVDKIVENDGQIGLSSSGLGEVDENGYVIEESYELERYFDFVINPSYSVFATSESKKESIEEDTKKINIKDESMNKKLSKVEEKNLRYNLDNLLEKANNITDIQEKINAYEDMQDYNTDEDNGESYLSEYKQIISSKLDELYKEKEVLAKKGLKTDTLEEQNSKLILENEQLTKKYEQLMEKYEISSTINDDLKLHSKKAKEMYEQAIARGNSKGDPKEVYKLTQMIENQIDINKKLSKELSLEKVSKEKIKEKYNDLSKKMTEEKREKERIERQEQIERDRLIKEYKEKEKQAKIKKQRQLKEKKEREKIENINVTEIDKIEEYVNDLVEQNPKYEKYRNQFLNCKTLFEAERFAIDLNEDIYGDTSVLSYVRKAELVENNDRQNFFNNDEKLKYKSPSKLPKGWQ